MELHEKINLRGNREQHAAISVNKKTKVLRRGVWSINNVHITSKTHQTRNFSPFY